MLSGLKKNINKELLLTFLSLGFGLMFFRFVTDDYSAFSFGCAAKQFSDFHYFEYFWQGLIGYSEVYRFLYGISDTYNWMMISWICFGLVGLYLSLRFIKNVALGKDVNFWVVVLVEILFSLLYLENFFSLSHTRYSLMFCGLGLINLAFREKLKTWEVLSYSSLFVAGMLMRPEGGLGIMMLVCGAMLIYKFNLVFLFRRMLIPGAAFLLIIGAIFIDWYTTDAFVKKLEPEVEYSFMERKTVDISTMTNPKDSIKYELAVRAMWIDPKEISPEFLRSLIKPGSNFSYRHLMEAAEHISHLYLKYLAFPALMLFLVFILLLHARWEAALRLALFLAFSYLLLFAVDYKGLLLSGRHFLGFQLIILLISLCYFPDDKAELNKSKLALSTGFLPILLACYYTFSQYRADNKNIWQTTENMQGIMYWVEENYKDRLIVVTNETRYCLDRHPSIKNNIYKENKYILFDNGTNSIMPRYSDYFKRLTGYGIEYPEKLMEWYVGQDALYMAENERYAITSAYFREIYGMQLEFPDSVGLNKLAADESLMNHNYEIRSMRLNGMND